MSTQVKADNDREARELAADRICQFTPVDMECEIRTRKEK